MKTITEISVHSEGQNPIFGEFVTKVRLEDEAAGAFIVVSQEERELRLDYEDMVEIMDAAKVLLEQQGVKCAE